MSKISSLTYSRAFSATNNLPKAAGNYNNSKAAIAAKVIFGVLTLGIGYGIILLIEKYTRSNPKIEAFCAHVQTIKSALSDACAKKRSSITVSLNYGIENLELTLVENIDGGVDFFDQYGNKSVINQVDFKMLHEKLTKDIHDNPGYYVGLPNIFNEAPVVTFCKNSNEINSDTLTRDTVQMTENITVESEAEIDILDDAHSIRQNSIYFNSSDSRQSDVSIKSMTSEKSDYVSFNDDFIEFDIKNDGTCLYRCHLAISKHDATWLNDKTAQDVRNEICHNNSFIKSVIINAITDATKDILELGMNHPPIDLAQSLGDKTFAENIFLKHVSNEFTLCDPTAIAAELGSCSKEDMAWIEAFVQFCDARIKANLPGLIDELFKEKNASETYLRKVRGNNYTLIAKESFFLKQSLNNNIKNINLREAQSFIKKITPSDDVFLSIRKDLLGAIESINDEKIGKISLHFSYGAVDIAIHSKESLISCVISLLTHFFPEDVDRYLSVETGANNKGLTSTDLATNSKSLLHMTLTQILMEVIDEIKDGQRKIVNQLRDRAIPATKLEPKIEICMTTAHAKKMLIKFDRQFPGVTICSALGVPENTTDFAIFNKTYKKTILALHPDKNPSPDVVILARQATVAIRILREIFHAQEITTKVSETKIFTTSQTEWRPETEIFLNENLLESYLLKNPIAWYKIMMTLDVFCNPLYPSTASTTNIELLRSHINDPNQASILSFFNMHICIQDTPYLLEKIIPTLKKLWTSTKDALDAKKDLDFAIWGSNDDMQKLVTIIDIRFYKISEVDLKYVT
jgi:hypothetical protein